MSETNEKTLSRRKAILRFGALALAAYAAPSLTTMSMAHASSSSGPSPRSAASGPSPKSAPSNNSAPTQASAPTAPTTCSSPPDSRGGTPTPGDEALRRGRPRRGAGPGRDPCSLIS
ncbi:MAG: hypothetical protein LPJ95_11740, partial [Paracoccaceae bacterium]|nr:hypothetical protein [Paracoccaceae bacterium]